MNINNPQLSEYVSVRHRERYEKAQPARVLALSRASRSKALVDLSQNPDSAISDLNLGSLRRAFGSGYQGILVGAGRLCSLGRVAHHRGGISQSPRRNRNGSQRYAPLGLAVNGCASTPMQTHSTSPFSNVPTTIPVPSCFNTVASSS